MGRRSPVARAARRAASSPVRWRWWRPATILLAGALTYWNGLSGPFIFDDLATVVQNPRIRDLARLGLVLVPPANTPVAGRPLVNLTFAINYALGGLDVGGYHVVNLALHLL